MNTTKFFLLFWVMVGNVYAQIGIIKELPERRTLIMDINPACSLPGKYLFTVFDSLYGEELFAGDIHTPQQAVMLADIHPGPASSVLKAFAKVGNEAWFVHKKLVGSEIWKTDGTPQGTVRIYESSLEITRWKTDGNLVCFAQARNGIYAGLWAYTIGQSAAVKISSNGHQFTILNGFVYFNDFSSTTGRELYKSDGTIQGTSLLKDINPGFSHTDIDQLQTCGNQIVFFEFKSNSRKLYSSDGTASGTIVHQTFLNNPSGADTVRLRITMDQKAYINARTSGSSGIPINLWIYDPINSNITNLTNFQQFSSISNICLLSPLEGAGLAFIVESATSGALWRSDGTPAGTIQLPGGAVPKGYTGTISGFSDRFYVRPAVSYTTAILHYQNDTLVATPVNLKSYQPFIQYGDSLLYYDLGMICYSPDSQKTDTIFRRNYHGKEGRIGTICKVNNQIAVFDDFAGGSNGYELFRTDGVSSKFKVKEIGEEFRSAQAKNMTNLDNKVFFSAITLREGREPWVTDGTEAGTYQLADLNPGEGDSNPYTFHSLGNTLFVCSENIRTFPSTWAIDLPTWHVTNLQPATGKCEMLLDTRYQTYQQSVYFFMRNPDSTSNCVELWKSQGTINSTIKVKSLPTLCILLDYNIINNNIMYIFYHINSTQIQILSIDLISLQTHLFDTILVSTPGLYKNTNFAVTTSCVLFAANDGHIYKLFGLDSLKSINYDNSIIQNFDYDWAVSDTNVILNTGIKMYKMNLDGEHIQSVIYKDNSITETVIFLCFSRNIPILLSQKGVYSYNYNLDSVICIDWFSFYENHFFESPNFIAELDSGLLCISGNQNMLIRIISDENRIEYLPAHDYPLLINGAVSGPISGINQVLSSTENDSLLYFTNYENLLWATPVQDTGATQIAALPSVVLEHNTLQNSLLCTTFSSNNSYADKRLWLVRYPWNGAYQVKDVAMASTNIVRMNHLLYWCQWDSINSRIDLWQTDGSIGGFQQVATLMDSIFSKPAPQKIIVHDSVLYVSFKNIAGNTELIRSDGTPRGTTVCGQIAISAGQLMSHNEVFVYNKWFSLLEFQTASALYSRNVHDSLFTLVNAFAPEENVSSIFSIHDSLYLIASARTLPTSTAVLWRSDGSNQGTDTAFVLQDFYPQSQLTGPSVVVVDSIAYFTFNTSQTIWRTNGRRSGTWMTEDSATMAFLYYLPWYKTTTRYTRVGNNYLYASIYGSRGERLSHLTGRDSLSRHAKYSNFRENRTLLMTYKNIQNKLYLFGYPYYGSFPLFAYYMPVWETLPGAGPYPIDSAAGPGWHYALNDVQTVLGLNTNGLDLGTITVEMDDRLQPEVIDSMAFAPRHFAIHCAGGPDCPTDGVLPHPIRVQLYFADAELDSLNSVTGLPNPIEALDVVHYNGLVNDCDLSNNPLPGFTTRIPSTQVKARDWMYGFSLEFSTAELGEFAVTNDLVFNAVAPVRTPKDALQLWPNPGRDAVMVKTPCAHMHHLRVLDVTGKILLQEATGEASEYLLRISAIPAGTYIVQAETDCGLQSTLLVKAQ